MENVLHRYRDKRPTGLRDGVFGQGVTATRFAALSMLDQLDGLRTELRMTRSLPVPFPPEPLRGLAIR